MNQLSASDEIKKLVELPTRELLKEFTESRERFRKFLMDSGIDVPDIMNDSPSDSGESGTQNSILLDDFSSETISSIDESILSVYGTVASFDVLFTKIPESDILRNISLTLEDKDSVAAEKIHKSLQSGEINGEEQISVPASDLRALIPELNGEPPSEAGNKQEKAEASSLTEEDLKGIFEDDKKKAVAEEAATAEKPAEKGTAEELSPFISQEEYDSLIAGGPAGQKPAEKPAEQNTPEEKTEKTSEEDKEPVVALESSPEKPEASPVTESKGTEEVSQSEISQEELDGLLKSDDNAPESEHKMSQEELDAYLAGEPESGKMEGLSEEELDALKTNDNNSDDTAVSQDEIDNLLNGTGEPSGKKPDEDDDTAVSQDEIDNLLNGAADASGKKPDEDDDTAVSQDEIDNLLNGAGEPSPAKPEATEMPLAISQDELDNLFSRESSGDVLMKENEIEQYDSKLPRGKYDDKDMDVLDVSQDEINKLFDSENNSSDKKDDADLISEQDTENISTSETDSDTALPATKESKESEDASSMSQKELDALFDNNGKKAGAEKVMDENDINQVFEDIDNLKNSAKTNDSPADDPLVSNEELKELFDAKNKQDESDGENMAESITNDEIDKMFN